MRKYMFSIPQPCTSKWDDMIPTEKGRYCDSCAKQVIDFMGMTDAEVVNYVKKHGMACGRFDQSQLNRELQVPSKKTFMPAAILAGLLMAILPERGKAQAVKVDTVMTPVQEDTVKTKMVLEEIRPVIRNTGNDLYLQGVAGGLVQIDTNTRKKSWFRRLFR